MQLRFIFLSLFISITAFGGGKKKGDVQKNSLSIHHTYLKEAFTLTKNTVGFSAPVSGRAYGYLTIGMYETTVDLLPELVSLEGQLNGYSRTIDSSVMIDKMSWELAVNQSNYDLLRYLYRGMPPSNQKRLESIYDSIAERYSKCTSKKIRMSSQNYGATITSGVLDWSKTDGGDDGYLNNFPDDFELEKCSSCWVKTFPGYLSALVPYWGENRPMLAQSLTITEDMSIFEYSTDTASVMYQEALMVLENSKSEDPSFELIGEFWDDGTGRSGTPSGHFFTIAQQIAEQENISLTQAMELYAKLGVAVNDAFISSFRLKYQFNFIRPITYIHQFIDPQFNTRLASPPFPEYPSGHSFQSGAATEVMKGVFGDSLTIVDSTNVARTDIDGSPRTFNSFTEMSEEISISRFYGGIHFRRTLDNSLIYGRKIGNYVSTQLKCRGE